MSRRCPPCPPRAYLAGPSKPLTGFDFFDVDDEPPPPTPPGRVVLESLRRGSLVQVGGRGPVWQVYASQGSLVHHVVKHGTAGKKMYELMATPAYGATVHEMAYVNGRLAHVRPKPDAEGAVTVVGFEARP